MRVLVFEYITGGGLRGESLPAGLLREGSLMLESVVADLLGVPGTAVTVLRDDRLPPLPARSGLTLVPVASSDDGPRLWIEGIAYSDAVLPIAPESGAILENLCRDVEQAGKTLLNTSSRGVRLAGSKLGTAQRLAAHGVTVVPTSVWHGERSAGPCVIKPDDGVGCEGAIILDSGDPAPAAGSPPLVVQPLLEGDALSLSGLFANGVCRLLSCNRQRIERVGNGFALRGCRVNAMPDEDGIWQALLDGIAQAVPELWGYAGVDVIWDGTVPVVLEINPRLTTSYAGLRQALGVNPAGLLLDLAGSGCLPVAGRGLESVEIFLEPDFAG